MSSLTLLVLRVTDLERSRAFYEAIGLTFTREQHGNGPVHLAATMHTGSVLELYPAREGTLDVARLGLRPVSFEDTIARLEALGNTVTASGDRWLAVDPDGRHVELTR